MDALGTNIVLFFIIFISGKCDDYGRYIIERDVRKENQRGKPG
jgi:hypothetical protein